MGDYEEQIKKLQADAMAKLSEDFAEAARRANRDTVRAERKLFTFELSEARLSQGLSQSELACRSGVPQARISRIEAGKANPSLNTLLKIAKVLSRRIVIE